MYELVADRGIERGAVFPLKEGENLIGRSIDCAVQLMASDISRTHLMIRVSGPTVTAENLSQRACLLDGQPLQAPTAVRSGQQFTLGRTTLLTLREVEEIPTRPPADDEFHDLPTQPGGAVGAVRPDPEGRVSEPEQPNAVTIPSVSAPSPNAGPVAKKAEEVGGDDASGVGDVFLSRAPAAGDADVDEPLSGFVDLRAKPEEAAEDSFEAVSMVGVARGPLVKKDTDFAPSLDSGSIVVPGAVPPPREEVQESEDDEPKTQGLSRDAMDYIRRQQRRKARIRMAIIVGGIILGLVLLAALILNI
jgi:hypothetical protein